MDMETIAGIGALIVIMAFMVFAFRKGLSVKPSDNPPRGSDHT